MNQYLIRLDDICDTMNMKNFMYAMEIFTKYKIVPIVGIVPKNIDPDLKIAQIDNSFWPTIKQFYEDGDIVVALHGYNHGLDSISLGVSPFPVSNRGKYSEFVGKKFDDQYLKIKKGREILCEKGLDVEWFIAPAHSFDEFTLKALSELDFKYVSDGSHLYPYDINGLCIVPQQFGTFRKFPFGLITVCLHLNEFEEKDFKALESFCKEVKSNNPNDIQSENNPIKNLFNKIFSYTYIFLRFLNKFKLNIN